MKVIDPEVQRQILAALDQGRTIREHQSSSGMVLAYTWEGPFVTMPRLDLYHELDELIRDGRVQVGHDRIATITDKGRSSLKGEAQIHRRGCGCYLTPNYGAVITVCEWHTALQKRVEQLEGRE